jgi:hypothetical protein
MSSWNFLSHFFFGLVSGSKIFIVQRRNSELSCVKFLSLDSLYSEIYSLRKLGFWAGPDLSLKKVFLGKLLYQKLQTSKLSEICSIG